MGLGDVCRRLDGLHAWRSRCRLLGSGSTVLRRVRTIYVETPTHRPLRRQSDRCRNKRARSRHAFRRESPQRDIEGAKGPGEANHRSFHALLLECHSYPMCKRYDAKKMVNLRRKRAPRDFEQLEFSGDGELWAPSVSTPAPSRLFHALRAMPPMRNTCRSLASGPSRTARRRRLVPAVVARSQPHLR
jgi:hypothetical protein